MPESASAPSLQENIRIDVLLGEPRFNLVKGPQFKGGGRIVRISQCQSDRLRIDKCFQLIFKGLLLSRHIDATLITKPTTVEISASCRDEKSVPNSREPSALAFGLEGIS